MNAMSASRQRHIHSIIHQDPRRRPAGDRYRFTRQFKERAGGKMLFPQLDHLDALAHGALQVMPRAVVRYVITPHLENPQAFHGELHQPLRIAREAFILLALHRHRHTAGELHQHTMRTRYHAHQFRR